MKYKKKSTKNNINKFNDTISNNRDKLYQEDPTKSFNTTNRKNMPKLKCFDCQTPLEIEDKNCPICGDDTKDEKFVKHTFN